MLPRGIDTVRRYVRKIPMREILSPIAWLRALSIESKFTIIMVITVGLLAVGMGELYFGMKVMTGIRAYVGGEGLWSKAQKEAFSSLLHYAASGDDEDYDTFRRLLEVTHGDRAARLELDKPHPDYNIVRAGFIAGGNHPDDMDDMIFLYRNFRDVSYIENAVTAWAEGDMLIADLERTGSDMHAVLATSHAAPNTVELQRVIKEATAIDHELTLREDRFSATLGEGARHMQVMLLSLAGFIAIALGIGALILFGLLKKLIVQVDTAKSEFVALVSHQLRSPLTLMSWSLERLGYEKSGTKTLPATAQEDLKTLRHEVRRMTALINDILDVSRLEAGTMIIQPYDIDLVALTKETLSAIRPIALDRKVLIRESFPASVIIRIDPTLMHVVLVNLLSNAIKYTPADGTVSISIVKRQNDVEIGIADTGYGIPFDEQSQVFGKLFRGAKAVKADSVGSGLGLYIAKSIMNEAGGDIRFTSEEGKGTCFFVTLPHSGMQPKGGDIHLNDNPPRLSGTINS